MIKAIFFDLHEVVTHGDFLGIYKNFAERVGIPLEMVVNYHDENIRGLLTGAVTSEQMHSVFGLGDRFTVEEMMQIWEEETVKIMTMDPQMILLLKSLRETYTLVALTNLTEQRYRADITMGLYDYFDHAILSFKEGVKKPDPAFFSQALSLSKVKSEEVLFIDDQLKNTEAAESLGIKSIQFTDYEILVHKLADLGIKF